MLLGVGVALVGFGIPLAITVAARDRDQALLELSAEAASAAVAVPGSFAQANDLPELPDPAEEIDLALYSADGRRILGEGPPNADPLVAEVLDTGTARRDRSQLVVAIPVTNEERVVGAIRARFPEATITARTRRTWLTMGGLAAGVFTFTSLLALHRSRALAAPLARLQTDAQRIGDGASPTERPHTGIDEIDTVDRALRDAAARVNDALSRERAFSADIAHQLRTPVASLRLRLENEQLEADHDTGLVADALRDLDRLETTMDDLIQLARDTTPTGEPHPLATLVHDAVERWRPRLTQLSRQLDGRLEPELPWVTARPEAVRQILDVLIDNARVHGAGTITIRATRVGNGAIIAVSDQGTTALDPETAFARRSGEGTGIGLALARRLAETEGLRLVIAEPGPGARFHLAFA
ncbi:MAG: HAMP domain-containing sensor histidine kinase [Acidimicrobiales bacterium]